MALTSPTIPDDGDGLPEHATPYAWIVFTLTFGLLMSDYMSRQVLNAVFPLLKTEWGLSDGQLGGLSGVVALMVGLLAVPLSFVADRFGRVKSLVAMAALWSVATLVCGLARDHGDMLVGRLFVGVGEAAYGSVGLAIVLGFFPSHMRATLSGAFLSGGIFGSVLGVALGGQIAATYGWRSAFFVMAVLGLVLATIYAVVVRPKTRVESPAHGPDGNEAPSCPAFRNLFGSPSIVGSYAASGLQYFVLAALMAWLPSFLNRYYDVSVDRAGVFAAGYLLISGLGMIVCGVISDRLSRSSIEHAASFAVGVCVATSLLLFTAFGLSPGPVQLVVLAIGMLFVSGTSGISGAFVANLSPARLHGSALAILTLSSNILGLAPGPVLTGLAADAFGLAGALQVASLVSLLAALSFALVRRRYNFDSHNLARNESACVAAN